MYHPQIETTNHVHDALPGARGQQDWVYRDYNMTVLLYLSLE